MFAHQVIEDLKKQEEGYSIGYSMWIKYCRKLVEKAHCFHVGEVTDLHSATRSTDGEQLFLKQSKFMRLPFHTVWIDAKSTKGHKHHNAEEIITKEGILVAQVFKDSDKYILCFIISYAESFKSWILIPLAYLISIGENYTQQSYEMLSNHLKIPFGKSTGRGNTKIIILDEKFPFDQVERQSSTNYLNLQMLQDTLLLLNCKNITTETCKPDEALNKSRRKKGKQELLTYKTLKLLLPGNKEKHLLADEPTGEHNRIHFCRGHFKEYTADAPLFGRITGLWWWQPHVRGQNKDGIVMKDYEIEAKGE